MEEDISMTALLTAYPRHKPHKGRIWCASHLGPSITLFFAALRTSNEPYRWWIRD
jgi:hypothetical protein